MNGGGYRVTLWNLNRQQRIEMIGELDLELQASALGLILLPTSGFTKTAFNLNDGNFLASSLK